jgi:hypothetical protein
MFLFLTYLYIDPALSEKQPAPCVRATASNFITRIKSAAGQITLDDRCPYLDTF